MPFEFFPLEVRDGRVLVHTGLILGLVAIWRGAFAVQANRVAIVTWFILLALLWYATMWGFFYNHGAGGLHYFAPFYLLLAYLVATRTDWATRTVDWSVAIPAMLLVAGLPWQTVGAQASQLAEAAERGRQFQREIASLTGSSYVYSEDVHLFRRHYAGEVIDVGDMVAEVAATGFMGSDFRRVVQRHFDALERSPPPFVLLGSSDVVSPELQRLLAKRYVVATQSAPLIPAEFGWTITLYRLRSAVVPSQP